MLSFAPWCKMAVDNKTQLHEFLTDTREKINKKLDELLPPEDSEPIILHQAMRYAALKGGKRIRPAVMLAVVNMLDGNAELALGPAAVLELIHTASLILDDLPCMDDASRRRGLPTVHLVFGEDQAVLAGVALLNLAYQHLAGWEKAGIAGMAESLRDVAMAVGTSGTIGGQSADLATHPDSATFERLEYIHSHKTGALFIAGALMGARLAGAEAEALKDIERYAKNLGLAYQIMDDILDVVSTPEITGKTVGRDEMKVTFVRFIGLDAAKKLVAELTDFAISSLGRFGTKAGLLTELAKMLSHRDR
jgi:geranylgeranyl diphosphate synthase type II